MFISICFGNENTSDFWNSLAKFKGFLRRSFFRAFTFLALNLCALKSWKSFIILDPNGGQKIP